ncbi:MAG: HD domain-containing protein [Clostridiales bacterium]|nr:HD domain-containing protein [Clostridiales bacterium]
MLCVTVTAGACLSGAVLKTPSVSAFAESFVRQEEESGDTPSSTSDIDSLPETIYTTKTSEGYSSILYNNTNGLPTSEANAVAETRDGFIWIGSYSGLIRYDGNTFTRIDSSYGISSVICLFVDSRNRLWVGTNDCGVAVVEGDSWHVYNKRDGLRSLSVQSIAEDDHGNIYLGTTNGLCMVDENMTIETIYNTDLIREYIQVLKTAPDGMVYGATSAGAIFTLQDKEVKDIYTPKELGISSLHSLLPDPENPGYVYLATKNSEIYYGRIGKTAQELECIDTSPLTYLNSMTMLDGKLWVCADNGIGYLEDDQCFTLDNIPMNTSIEGMMMDYQGNLWFVSSQQGVMKIVENRFTDIFEGAGLSDKVVYSTCLYDGKLFIGTKNSGLIVLEGHKQITTFPITEAVTASGEVLPETDLIELLRTAKVRSIIKDSRDRLWFSTYSKNALVRYDHGKVLVFREADGLPSERVRAVCEREDGSFAVACTGGVVIIRSNKIERLYVNRDQFENTEILTVVEADNGDILAGTDGGGIYVIRKDGVKCISTDDGLSSDIVMRIKKDSDRGIYWLVTSNSISFLTWDYEVRTIKSFPYSNNFDMYENSKGEMWILSSNGIYVVPTGTLVLDKDIVVDFYGRDDGLPCITTSNSYSALTPEGDLYICGTTGVAKVNIEEPFDLKNDVMMSVPYVEGDGMRFYPDAEGVITVPKDIHKVTICAFVFNYSMINPEISYRLEGFDNQETIVKRSDLKGLDYTNISGGKYVFTMKLLDSHENPIQELTVNIVKEKTVFERYWFRTFCVLFLLLFGALLFMLYTRKKMERFRKKEQENKLLVREIVEAFAKVIDMKDKYTNGHSSRVAEYTAMLTRELGYDEDTIEKYYNIALLHDIGKIGVPEEVLNKPGKLTDEEFARIKSHSALGQHTLKNISIMPELAIGAGSHHERPDGRGYPEGLKGDEIPRVAQIIAVADTFDAMYSDRPYRKRMNFEKAISIIKEVSGTQLQEDVVDAFLRLVDRGAFRAEDDEGGGSTEDINNIHKKQNQQESGAEKAAEKKDEPKSDDAKGEGEKPAEKKDDAKGEAEKPAEKKDDAKGEGEKPAEKKDDAKGEAEKPDGAKSGDSEK